MELSYYGFAFFIFMLFCIFALLCKHLFMRNKGHMQNMDEKEKKLLALYSTMEDMMDEFNQTALAANDEVNRHIVEMRNIKANLRPPPPPLPAALPAVPVPPAHSLPAPIPLHAAAPPPLPAAPATDPALNRPALAPEPQDFTPLTLPEVTVKEERIPDRSSRIVALREAGMDRLHIAKQLSVTLSEVDLVLGIAAQKK